MPISQLVFPPKQESNSTGPPSRSRRNSFALGGAFTRAQLEYAEDQPSPPVGLPPGGYYTVDGGYYYPTPPQAVVVTEALQVTFENKAVRHKFILKVYAILAAQLLFTTGLIALFLFEKNTRNFFQQDKLKYLWVAVGIMFLLVYFLLLCFECTRRKFPLNVFMLLIFTLLLAFMAAFWASFYGETVVLIAFGSTTAICILTSIFAMQTKLDLTLYWSIILITGLTLIVLSLMIILFPDQVLKLIYSTVGVFFFGMFLAYDTQQILGGKSVRMSPDEYIFGALHLYLDFVLIFCCFVQCAAAGDTAVRDLAHPA